MRIHVKPVGPIGTNCYIAADDSGVCAVIDPGAQADKLAAFLQAQGLKPAYILLTHGHFDHIGAVKALVRRFGCRLAIGANDAEQLADVNKSSATGWGLTAEDYLMTPDVVLHEGDRLTVGELAFEVLDTPGHTRGGVTYKCGDALFTGDTLFAGDVGRTDLYGGSYSAIIASVRKLAALPGNLRVLPGHGPESTLDAERRYNPYVNEELRG